MSSSNPTDNADKDGNEAAPPAAAPAGTPAAAAAAAATPAATTDDTGAGAETAAAKPPAAPVPATATTTGQAATKPAPAAAAGMTAAAIQPPQQQQAHAHYPTATAPPATAAFPPPHQPRFPYAAPTPAATAAQMTWASHAAASVLPPPPAGMNHEAALRYERTRISTLELNFKKEIQALKQRNEELEAKLKLDVQYERTRFNAMELNYKAEIERLQKQAAEAETKLKVGQVEQQKLSKSLAAEKKTSAKRKAELSDVKERARKVKKGIPYTKYDAKWNMRYEQLKAYKEQHGNCNLSKRLHRNTQYKELASWVTHQRYEHKCLREGKYTSLNPTRVKLLTQLGFEWRVAANEQLSWDERFMQLLEFQAINGHTRVPQKHDKPPGLGHWVLDQRKYYRRRDTEKKTKILTPERIEKLEAIGFEWSLRNHSKTRAPGGSTTKKPAPQAAAAPAGAAPPHVMMPGGMGMVVPPGARVPAGMGMLPPAAGLAPPGGRSDQQQNPKNVSV